MRRGPKGNDDRLAEHLAHLRLRGLRPSTLDQRRYAIHRLAKALDMNPLRASADDLDRWQHGLVMSATSRLSVVNHVQQYYQWAKKVGLIRVNPSLELVRPKRLHRLPRPIPEDQLQIALENASDDIRAQLVLAAWCGLRAREIALLQRDHIHDRADPPVLVVADGKGGRARVVPLGDGVLAELRAYGLPSRGPVFPRMDGRPGHQTPSRVSGRANSYLHEIGITDTLHALRHRYGTALYRESKDLRMVQDLLGHSDPAMTALYCAYSPTGAMAAVRALDATLPGAGRARAHDGDQLTASVLIAKEEPAESQASELTPPECLQQIIGAPLPAAVPIPVSEPGVLERVREAAAARAAAKVKPLLSEREVEVLQLVAAGLTNAGIGERLGLSPLTVKSHLARISERVGSRTRTQLVVYAMSHGLL